MSPLLYDFLNCLAVMRLEMDASEQNKMDGDGDDVPLMLIAGER
jgi:hypothetical protein